MSNNPITKVARNGFDARTASDVNLSFSSKWKTPKIFLQKGASNVTFSLDDVVSPAGAGGAYVVDGEHNGRRAFTNGSYWIWWNGSDRWNLTATKGSGTVVFYHPDDAYLSDNPVGYYLAGTGVGSQSGWYGGVYYEDMAYFFRALADETWVNTLGYIPSFLAFRQLGADTPDTGYRQFTGKEYTYSLTSTKTDPFDDGVTFYGNDLTIKPFEGDDGAYGILFLEPLDGTPPESYALKAGGVFLLGSGDVEVRTAFPTDNSVDTRFDTFKIFKTGTLEIQLPTETLIAGASPVVRTATVHHNLGYPPVFLPEATIGWGIDIASDFIINEELGSITGRSGSDDNYIDVYVDSEYLYLKYTRHSYSGGDRNYNEALLTMYYTIFYNEIGEEFNFLNDEYK